MRGRKALTGLGVVVAVLAAGELGFASIPDASGVIHGCYQTNGGGLIGGSAPGALRVIDTAKGQKCTNAETAVSWNQQGPKGDTGAAGATGPIGPAGAKGDPGTNGVSGYEQVVVNAVVLVNETRDFIVTCPAGKKVVGGGWAAGTSKPMDIETNGPYRGNTSGDSWEVRMTNNTGVNAGIPVTAVCVNA